MNRFNFANTINTGLSAVGAVGTYAFRPLKEQKIREKEEDKRLEQTLNSIMMDIGSDELRKRGNLDETANITMGVDETISDVLKDDHEKEYYKDLLTRYKNRYGEKGIQFFTDEAKEDIKNTLYDFGLSAAYNAPFDESAPSETQKSMDEYLRNKYDSAAKFLKGPNDEDFIKYLTRNYDFSEWKKEDQ